MHEDTGRFNADEMVDSGGAPGLAARLGYGVRQVERSLLAELGAGPLGPGARPAGAACGC